MINLADTFYEIVANQHRHHQESGFTKGHAYAQGTLKGILDEMDKARNLALEQKYSNGPEKKNGID